MPREAVDASSLEAFNKLDGALGSLLYRLATLPTAGRLELYDLEGPLQAKSFYDSKIL